ncbi:hypothetical protein LCGC14_0563070 [marine sediment metagenome]|uniref:Uncharacterized protein n=1 Tax=marine sediment metagenome TaxID=412755 RepID=A0A0F9RRR5_9ZZZZ
MNPNPSRRIRAAHSVVVGLVLAVAATAAADTINITSPMLYGNANKIVLPQKSILISRGQSASGGVTLRLSSLLQPGISYRGGRRLPLSPLPGRPLRSPGGVRHAPDAPREISPAIRQLLLRLSERLRARPEYRPPAPPTSRSGPLGGAERPGQPRPPAESHTLNQPDKGPLPAPSVNHAGTSAPTGPRRRWRYSSLSGGRALLAADSSSRGRNGQRQPARTARPSAPMPSLVANRPTHPSGLQRRTRSRVLSGPASVRPPARQRQSVRYARTRQAYARPFIRPYRTSTR